MRSRGPEERIHLHVSDAIASYDEMIQVVQSYIDKVLSGTDTAGGSVVFCAELPEAGEEGILYVSTGERVLYLWDVTAQGFVQILGYETATAEETGRMLDDVFGARGGE